MTKTARGGKVPNNGEINPDIQILSLAAPIRHALRGLGYLASRPGENLRAAHVARALRLPSAALSKSFQQLAATGLLESRRGPGGGYRLARPPAKTSLVEVAQALDVQDRRLGHCVLEDRPCRGDAPCVIHHAAKDADADLRRELSRLTLAHLAAAQAPRRTPK